MMFTRKSRERTSDDRELMRKAYVSDGPSAMRNRQGAKNSLGNQQLQRLLEQRTIQPKLTVSEPDDKYEREADRIADAVMRMSESTTVEERPVGEVDSDRVQRMCTRCRRRARQGKPLNCSDCEEELQRKVTSRRITGENPDLEHQIESVRGGGRSLPSSVRSFFEPRFGRDFSDVRVHTDNRADAAARSVNAEAFTVGRDIAFRSGAYQPGTKSGRRLLAHELTHVVQQANDTLNRSDAVFRRQPQTETDESEEYDPENSTETSKLRKYAEARVKQVQAGNTTDCEAMKDIYDKATGLYPSATFNHPYVRGVTYTLAGVNEWATGTDGTQVSGFGDSGFKNKFQDGSNQVQHFSGGVMAGWQYGPGAVVGHSLLRPDSPEDEALNAESTYLGMRLSLPWNSPSISPGYIRTNVCA
jgi:hypothetical protein